MFRLLGVIISFTMLLLLHLYFVKLCFMLVSASGTDKKKKKKGPLKLLCCLLCTLYAKNLYFCKNIIFSWHAW
jgi:hypothetical protein